MLDKIIRFSLNNRLAIVLAAVIVLAAGVITASRMDVDVFPDLNAPTVVVMTEARGMASEEVERLVTFPIETSVNGATGVRRVRSSSTNGFSVVWVEFEWDMDVYLARQIVSEKIAMTRDRLPPQAGSPTLGPQSSILGEVMFVSLTADSTSLADLRTLADWEVRPRLMATGGVAQVAVIGGDVKEYQILLNPARMARLGVSLADVRASVTGMNQNTTGGTIYEYGNEYIVRGVTSETDAAELGKAAIRTADGRTLTLSDVAKVECGSKEPRMGLASHDGRPAVIMTVTKQPNASTLDITVRVDDALKKIETELPPDVRVDTGIYRQERFIESSIKNVKEALIEGGVFVVIILFVFLMNVRTTVISLITIPLSLVMSILCLRAMGLTINTMSLGGMAIAIGSLVDDAIVDVENVFKRLRENAALPAAERRSRTEVVFEASREVRIPILNSTIIIIVSFVPLFFLSGMEGRMLAPLGVAFITSLVASTIVALTLTPVMGSYLLSGEGKGGKAQGEPVVERKLKGVYAKALAWALRRRRAVLIGTGAVLAAALAAYCTLGSSFLPPFNEGSFTINVSAMPGVALDESDAIGRQVEDSLLSIPEIMTVGRKTGRAELDEHALGVNVSEIEAPYELRERSKAELMADVRRKLGSIPGIAVEVGSPISHRIDAMLSGSKSNLAIKVFGDDLNRLFSIGNEVKEAIEGIDGLADLNVEQQVERPQLQIIPKREMLARHGVTMPEFAEAVDVLLAGEQVSTVYEGNKSFDLTLKVEPDSRATAERIADLMVDGAQGKVPLGSLAEIRSSAGPNTINRENASRKIVVSASVTGGDLVGTVGKVREAIEEKVGLPEGYHVEYGGQFESEQTASRTLLGASVLSILVIFLLLYNQFKNAVESAVILLNLPLALIGGVMVIWLTGSAVSIPAIIGFISLFGIATRNGMLLIARYNDLRAEGRTLAESVALGSADRLNPILMTALTSALALLPLVVGGDLPGNEIQSPMAKVLLGGLVTSTLLNGFIIPIMYTLINTPRSASSEANNDKE